MGALLDRIASPSALADSWKRVLANDAADDVLSAGVQRFAKDTDTRLGELRERLLGGEYVPARLARVSIPKEDGEERVLHIPPVADRIVERAVLSVLTPLIDPLLGPSSFAYRPGLGVVDAVQEVARFRDEGFTHVLRTDIEDCFPSIQIEPLRRILGVLVSDPELMAVLDLLLARPLHGPGRRRNRPGIGLPQGSPLSPILANLVLEHLDDRLRRAGYPAVRYGDDMVIFATSRDDALEAGRIASTAAGEIGMKLGEDKTDAMSFEDGFCFLGEDFGTRYPPVIEDRIDVPEERTVFVGAAGSRVRIGEGRVIVERDDEELLDVPAGLVARIVCFGPVGVTAGLRNWALSSGVELVFCSQRGRYLGQVVSGHVNRVERLRNQLAASDTPARFLPLARQLVEAKIRKQAVLLRRTMRKESARELAEGVEMMEGYADMLSDAGSREEIMGLEGAAARAYFQAWTACVDPAFGFTGRNRRPPLDVVNSALSFGYAILLSEAVSALVATGLDPAIGFLHTDHDGRPSLALDLVEEFRPLIVDQIVMEAPTPVAARTWPPGRGSRRGIAYRGGPGGHPGRLRAPDVADDPGGAAGLRGYVAAAPLPSGSDAGVLGGGPRTGVCGSVMALTVLVCYDISRDAARARVAAYLQQWGDRIQRSVFVCAVAPEDLDDMVSRIEEMIDPRTDAVHLLPTCATCWSRLVVRGQADATPDKPYWAVL